MANARNSDLFTSHEAAKSVKNISLTQQTILSLLKRPMADEELIHHYQVRMRLGNAPRASDSGIRSRRAELVRLGLVIPVDVGRTVSNRKTLIWVAA